MINPIIIATISTAYIDNLDVNRLVIDILNSGIYTPIPVIPVLGSLDPPV